MPASPPRSWSSASSRAEGKTRHDLGREKFVERVWQWKQQSGSTITRQMRRLGASANWQDEYFTMDEKMSRAVVEVFVRLYEEGLIYRGKRLVNWDPVLGTAVSDLEVDTEETTARCGASSTRSSTARSPRRTRRASPSSCAA